MTEHPRKSPRKTMVHAGDAPKAAPKAVRWPIVMAVLLAVLLETACATRPDPDDTAAVQAYEEANDPIEPFNRYMFEVNIFADTFFLKPAATWYAGIVPRFMRNGIRNFLDNLNSPVVLINNLLQGEWDQAGDTLARFTINTTIGLGGLVDAADDAGLPQRTTSFNRTLATWGIGEGPYLYLPILGPSPPRRLAGFITDRLFDPLNYADVDNDIRWARVIVGGIDLRARNLGVLESLEKTSVDYYATIRNLSRQLDRRPAGTAPTDINDLPDLPDIDELNLDLPQSDP